MRRQRSGPRLRYYLRGHRARRAGKVALVWCRHVMEPPPEAQHAHRKSRTVVPTPVSCSNPSQQVPPPSPLKRRTQMSRKKQTPHSSPQGIHSTSTGGKGRKKKEDIFQKKKNIGYPGFYTAFRPRGAGSVRIGLTRSAQKKIFPPPQGII